ncbi:hypothetical protein DL765_008193 [Monosporascus sp. GIB2]|nr:hypothetical protein DL765_008193 [Monosporascus sp. GIB2]
MSAPLFEVPPSTSLASGRIGQILRDANLDATDSHHGAMLNDMSPHLGQKAGGIRFKALRFAKSDINDNLEEMATESKKITSAVGYAKDWKEVCLKQLQIPESDMNNIKASMAEMAYTGFLQNRVSLDSWFSLYVIMIPCIYGWHQIAKKLENDPKTNKKTKFYETWIKPNLDDNSANKLSAFLESNREFHTSGFTTSRWAQLFVTALKLELCLFDSVLPQTGSAES